VSTTNLSQGKTKAKQKNCFSLHKISWGGEVSGIHKVLPPTRQKNELWKQVQLITWNPDMPSAHGLLPGSWARSSAHFLLLVACCKPTSDLSWGRFR